VPPPPPPAEDDDVENTLANSDVCTKYREAGRIASLALQGIKSMVMLGREFRCHFFLIPLLFSNVSQIKDGASILELCKFGDTVIVQACGGIYQKKVKGVAVEKGIAFPT
jgi:methionine aminopeptidase